MLAANTNAWHTKGFDNAKSTHMARMGGHLHGRMSTHAHLACWEVWHLSWVPLLHRHSLADKDARVLDSHWFYTEVGLVLPSYCLCIVCVAMSVVLDL